MPTPCRGETCDAELVFAPHPTTGRLHPFDAGVGEPTKAGEVRYVVEEPARGDPVARRAKVGERGVLSHYATCSDRDDF